MRSRFLAGTITTTLLALVPGAGMRAAPGVPEVRTLPNGVTLVTFEDHALPLVAVSLWVHVGSKDEIETSRGYAHFLEHLIQRGTDSVGPFEYQKLAQRWGGTLSVRSNYDRTYITLTGVPSELESLIGAAAAMAFRATLKDPEIDQELGSLNQEIHTYYDQPDSVAFLETMRYAFPDHSYGVPMLGNFRTLGTLKHDALASFYKNLYVSNNMALVLAGDLEPERASRLAEAAFGKEKKSGTLAPKPPPPAPLAARGPIEKRLNLKEASVNLAFAGPGYRGADRPALEVIAHALGEAGGSPLLEALARDKAGSAAQVTYYQLEDGGMLYIALTPSTPELSYTAARSALAAIVEFKKQGLKEAKLRSLVEGILLGHRLRAERLAERAEDLGEAALFGGVRYAWDLPEAYRRLTPEEIRHVADRYLSEDGMRLLIILPKEAGPPAEESKQSYHEVFDQLSPPAKETAPAKTADLYPRNEAGRLTPGAWGDPRDAGGLKPPERIVLGNGLTVVIQEDHRNTVAAISLCVRAGSGDDPTGKEGLATLAGRLVALGAAAGARAEAARPGGQSVAAPMVQVERDLTEARLLTSPAALRPSLAILAAAVRHPPTEAAPLEAARKAGLETLNRRDDDPAFVALELFHEKVYAGQPYAHPASGTEAGLQSVTRDDLSSFFSRRVTPSKSFLAFAGDITAADAFRMARDLFGDWNGAPALKRGEPEGAGEAAGVPSTVGARAGQFTRTVAASPGRVLVGVPGDALGSPDFEGLRLLGTAATLRGFEEIVFTRRAAFSVTAMPEGLRAGGSLALDVAVSPGRRDEVVFDLQRLLRQLALEELPDDEVKVLGRVQEGKEAAALQGVGAFASNLAYREATGLGSASYRQVLSPAVRFTPTQLKDLAARTFRPESWIVVTVGPSGG